MSQRKVNKPLIGKEISRTSSPVLSGASQNLATGEVFVLDKNKNILAAGATVADTDTIYIAVATADTQAYSLPDGTAITGEQKLLCSEPIEGSHVLNYRGLAADSAATEQVVTIDLDTATSFASVVGTEYAIRVVYKDINEHPGQFTQTFRVTATTTDPADLTDAFVAEINKIGPSGTYESRVTASNSSDDLVLTGKVVTDNASSDEIDEYSQVEFEVSLFTENFDDAAITYTTTPEPGNGNPKLIRDKEKHARAFEGVTNITQFPVIKPDMRVEMTKWYDSIIIEHDREYVSADNQYKKEAPLTTEIFIPSGSGQTTDVLAVLNPWMASTPRAFGNVTV